MSYIEKMESELLAEQNEIKESLNLKPKKATQKKKKPETKKIIKKKAPKKEQKRKVDLHVTIPEDLKQKLEARAKKEHRSVAVMLELILEQGLNKS